MATLRFWEEVLIDITIFHKVYIRNTKEHSKYD